MRCTGCDRPPATCAPTVSVRVLDLRDERERTAEGVLDAEGIEVLHLPVLDPTFNWVDDAHDDLSTLLQHRYRTILDSFGDRFAGSVTAVVEVVAAEIPAPSPTTARSARTAPDC